MKINGRITAILLASALSLPVFSGCSGGVRGIDGIDWGEYDTLISDVRASSDPDERAELLSRAEDMLMETECVSPLYGYRDAYLSKPELENVYGTHFGAKCFMYAALRLPPDGEGTEGSGETGDGAAAYDTTVSAYLEKQPDSFDPALATTQSALTVVENTFAGLFAYDAEGNVTPALVSGYECSEDGLTYTFTLREGLLWSDGTPLGASDFVYSWRRVFDKETGSPYAYLLSVIALTEDDDGKLDISADETDTVLTVKLKDPCSYFTELCAFPALYPVNETCVESADGYLDVYDNVVDPDAWTIRANYVTSGAFTFSGTAEGKYVFKKNPSFYGAENMKTETLEVMFGTNGDDGYTLYEAGEIDYLGLIPRDLHSELAARGDYHADMLNGIYFLAYNFNCNAFANMYASDAALLRRALSLFIDREYITDTVTMNGERIALSVVPEGVSGRQSRSGKDGYFSEDTEENREEAREIIKKLGMDEDDDGVIDKSSRFTLSYLTTDSATDIAIAQAVQQDLAELGIMVKVTAAEERVFDFESGIFNYDIIALGAVSYYDDALSVLECWTTGAAGNYAHLGSVVITENENAY